MKMMNELKAPSSDCIMCASSAWNFEAAFDRLSEGETDLGVDPYYRELWSCGTCGHIINHHAIDLSKLYSATYWDRTYAEQIRSTYDRIMGLPEEKSDNKQRVSFVNDYWDRLSSCDSKTLLDIGAGLAVFPAGMKAEGWTAVALDPDKRAAQHAIDVAGVEAVCADFMTTEINRSFCLISLNKVLEHVPNPVEMLERVHNVLAPEGLVYLELPDGEAALRDTPARQEFFLEHYCAYSLPSLALLIKKAGFRCGYLDRLRQPSGKYTLRAIVHKP